MIFFKKIKFNISIPIKELQKGKSFEVSLKDDGTFIEALALVDKIEMEDVNGSIFPLYDGYIHNYLQLFVNIEEEYIYEDVGISPYAPDESGLLRKFNPIRENISFNIIPDTIIDLQQDVGC